MKIDKVEIRFSNQGELDISGSTPALRQIGQAMLDLVNNKERENCIIEGAIVDAQPYDGCLSAVSIIKSDTLTKVSVVEDYLQIEGDSKSLKGFASWFDFPDDTWSGYHHHFDYWDGNEWVDPDSMSLVIAVKNSIERP
jgi:hypothetical protein